MSAQVNRMQVRRHELLADVADLTAELVTEHGIAPDVAEQIGHSMADALSERWGGQNFTFPTDHFWRLSKREQAILAAWRSGVSTDLLGRQYKMAERSVRRLIRRAAARSRDLAQHSLFGEIAG